MTRGSHPKVRHFRCDRCGDSGLVLMIQHVEDRRAADGFRPVAMAHRCECQAGARMSKAFALVPPPERPLRLLRGDDPKD